ncbi:MAG: M48 family metallopeptidase [Fibrobacterota bacterium]
MSEKSKKYQRDRLLLKISETAFTFLFLLLLIFSPFSVAVRNFAVGISDNPVAQIIIFALFAGILKTILFLPIDFAEGFAVEKKYGLSNETVSGWLRKSVKGLLINTVLSCILLVIIFSILKFSPRYWWILSSGAVLFLSLILAAAAPVIIFPLFYKFLPVERPGLEDKLRLEMNKEGLNVKDILTFDMSRETKKANAALAGLGKTKRIIISDTLLNNFTDDEITAVFRHELGHHKFFHLPKLALAGFFLTVLSLYAGEISQKAALIYFPHLYGRLDPAALPALLFGVYTAGVLLKPLSNYYSRLLERQADLFSFESADTARHFISAMEKLTNMNLADPEPGRTEKILFYTHPPTGERIKEAEKHVEN